LTNFSCSGRFHYSLKICVNKKIITQRISHVE
jgi:hypothetical protein